MMAIELPADDIDRLFDTYAAEESRLEVDVDAELIKITSSSSEDSFRFRISEFDKTLVKTGGWVEYADTHY